MKTRIVIKGFIMFSFLIFGITIKMFAINDGKVPKDPKHRKIKYLSDKINFLKKSTYPGVSLGEMVTSSCYGPETEFNFIYRRRNNVFEFGDTFDLSARLTGIQLRYRYILTSDNPFLHLYLTSNIIYHHSAKLSDKANKFNYKSVNETEIPNYRTIEEYMGLGLTFRTILNIEIDTCFGIGSYQSKILTNDNRPDNFKFFRPDIGIGLCFKIGIIYRFGSTNSCSFN